MFANSPQSKYEVIDAEKAGEHEVQGQKATDIEWRVGLALTKLEIPFLFQFEIQGGQRRRGGVVIDFLALLPPLSVPIEVMGEWWHSSAFRAEDKLKEAMVRQQGNFAEMVYLFESELLTIPDAYQAVKRELRI